MNLPPLDPSNLEKSLRLTERLIQDVQKNGAIGFDEFLNLALYDSEYGYYSHSKPIFGTEGDFITAPTRSSLFSMTLAKQCLQILEQTTHGCIVEYGPGNGELCKEILLYLQQHSTLPEAYYLIETSPALTRYQKKLFEESIPDLLPKINWISQQQLSEFSGVVIANELFDALPFKRIQVKDKQLYEMRVDYQEQTFVWKLVEADDVVKGYVEQYIPKSVLTDDDYQTEIHLMYEPLLQRLSQTMQQGVFIVMDYGSTNRDYFSSDKAKGSMRCFYQHRMHDDPFVNIGFQDITCDVEFTTLANIAFNNGYDILGYTTQANFLIGNDIQTIYNEKLTNSELTDIQLSSEFKSLVMPDEMGERFKFLAIGKNYNQSLDGFAFKDLTYTL